MNFPFRQVHLDYHTAGDIPGVGTKFNADEFKNTLTAAAVDSITLFGVCHHGYCYYPSELGETHPSLQFDLLGEEIKAAKSAGIRTQIYISAGGNQVMALKHPEWREVPAPDGGVRWSCQGEMQPGFHKLCFNNDDYIDYLCELTKECISRYPENDGVFFDICFQFSCCSAKCLASVAANGGNPLVYKDRRRVADDALRRSFAKLEAAVHSVNPDLAVYFNSGDMLFRMPELQKNFTHFEIESLPTGGWGYDHFPLTVSGGRTNGKPVAGMTGKFHLSWGEFGGIKHPNALKYECAAMLAQGATCKVGDQLHPCGKLDETTYRVIGEAFREVRTKEPWCENAVNRAEIAMISAAACKLEDASENDVGVSRLLLESHFLFDNLRTDQDFSKYKLVIFPESYKVDDNMKKRLEKYFSQGGKVLFAGNSIMELPFDIGAEICGVNHLDPTYVLPIEEIRADYVNTPYVVYGSNILLKITDGESLGEVFDSYYNRDFTHFCSHCHTPNKTEKSPYAYGVSKGNITALAYPFFSIYRKNGSAVERQAFENLINRMLGNKRLVKSNLPSVARMSLTVDELNKREVLHLLYAPVCKRGDNVEIIEDFAPLCDIECEVSTIKKVKSVRIVPQGTELDFENTADGVKFKIDRFVCHAMIELTWID